MKTGNKTNLFFFAAPETGQTKARCRKECQKFFEEQLNAVRVIRLEQRDFGVPAHHFFTYDMILHRYIKLGNPLFLGKYHVF